ncbi:hypothetical protein L21SP2_2822 [Salinispira pacifica]|uniref:DEAD box helicase DbpA/CsdA RNA-binding domain-containing protein n=1 Tax=Salinispira pacifica TaxID=1307761 RepID=V5WK34_9SPIO|nr:hypothetical protein L21SP2_2822 [Salinispira pacifica]
MLFSARDHIINYNDRIPYYAIIQFCASALQKSEQRKHAEAPQGLIVVQRESDIDRFFSLTADHRPAWQVVTSAGNTRDLQIPQSSPELIIGSSASVIDLIRRQDIVPENIGLMIIIEANQENSFWIDIEFILTKTYMRNITAIFSPELHENHYGIMSYLRKPVTHQLQQWLNQQQEMIMAKRDNQINEEQLSDQLAGILKEIHENEDPQELDEFRRVFKKNVSVFKRAYVAAYMLKYFNAGGKRPSKRRRESNANMTSVFIGIGRTRRVYPRDIVGLVLDKTSLQREDIGNIKILDNYSFADINKEKTDEVISVLNGIEYRGRTLNVNYAKKKN